MVEEDYMLVERHNGKLWEMTNMWNLKNGQRFRMSDPNTGESFVGKDESTEWIVKGEPYVVEIGDKEIWSVNIEC